MKQANNTVGTCPCQRCKCTTRTVLHYQSRNYRPCQALNGGSPCLHRSWDISAGAAPDPSPSLSFTSSELVLQSWNELPISKPIYTTALTTNQLLLHSLYALSCNLLVLRKATALLRVGRTEHLASSTVKMAKERWKIHIYECYVQIHAVFYIALKAICGILLHPYKFNPAF